MESNLTARHADSALKVMNWE